MAGASPDSSDQQPRAVAVRWKHPDLLADGFVGVPVLFLKHYAHLKPFSLTQSEAMFVVQLMAFKWDAAAPFPGYKRLAGRMGISVKRARQIGQSLSTKKLLRRKVRVGNTNIFDLSPLFDALLVAAREDLAARAAKRRDEDAEEAAAGAAW